MIRDIADPINVHERVGDPEDSIGERVLLLLLAIATLFAAVFLLLPFVAMRKTWAALPRKANSALYFAALGLGFMFFEITLIQRLILFLGFPTYSLTVTLASLLIFTGCGALLSARFEAPDRPWPIRWLAPAIVAMGLLYLFVLPVITSALLTTAAVAAGRSSPSWCSRRSGCASACSCHSVSASSPSSPTTRRSTSPGVGRSTGSHR